MGGNISQLTMIFWTSGSLSRRGASMSCGSNMSQALFKNKTKR